MTMTSLLIHPATLRSVNNYLIDPGMPLLLIGPDGVGKSRLTSWIISKVSNQDQPLLSDAANLLLVSPQNNSISIDTIREVREFTKLRMLGTDVIGRYIVIEHANCMTNEAQNGLLKLLEEPPSDTLIILTAISRASLLDTIVSRCNVISVLTPPEDDIKNYFLGQGVDEQLYMQNYILTGGLPGLLHALVDQAGEHPLVGGVNQAKALLKSSGFDRLSLVDGLSLIHI